MENICSLIQNLKYHQNAELSIEQSFDHIAKSLSAKETQKKYWYSNFLASLLDLNFHPLGVLPTDRLKFNDL